LAEKHFSAALDRFAAGELERAATEYNKSITADPTFSDALHGLARVYLELNRLDDAIAVAKRISEVDPGDVLAHTSLSVIYQKKGMVAEAEAEGSKARILGWKEQLRQQKK
jgi:tetratricopeptide (TPR) repeat protein